MNFHNTVCGTTAQSNNVDNSVNLSVLVYVYMYSSLRVLASYARTDGHESPEGSSTLYHSLTNIVY